MDIGNTAVIKQVSTWNSGGGVEIDIVELTDGRILAISGDAITLYADMEDLTEGDPAKERPHIYL